MALGPAEKKLTEFLVSSDGTAAQHMTMDFSVSPPLLVYSNGEKFVALDPAGSKFFIDPSFQFGFEYNFSADPSIQAKVDGWGKAVWDKAKNEHLAKWIQNF